MRVALPPSLRKDRHSVEEEVAWARTLSPGERLSVVAALCRDAITLLQMNPKRDLLLSTRDPLPESTLRALARLRRR